MNYTLALKSTPLLVASEQEEGKVESMRTDREDLTEPKRRHKQKTTDGLVCYWMDAYNANASGGRPVVFEVANRIIIGSGHRIRRTMLRSREQQCWEQHVEQIGG